MKSQLLHVSGQQLARHDKRAKKIRRDLPRTDYFYQANREGNGSSSPAGRPAPGERAAQIRSFRELSKMVADTETGWPGAAEAIVFGLVIAIVVWPLISLLIVLAQTAIG